ncbi:hypothetical protein A3760_22955, partial [Oleiphilus sp. HI0122]
KETQEIEFAPITLLFGPNSVGKSSVLMALFYVQQILSKGQCDPRQLDALGGKKIKGFESLVHGRNTKNRITIKLDIDKKGEIGQTFAKLPDLINEDFGLTAESPCGIADSFSVELEIAWSAHKETAYVSQTRIWLDDRLVVKLESDAGLKQARISYINFHHPLLLSDEDAGEFALPTTELETLIQIGSHSRGNQTSEDNTSIGFLSKFGAIVIPGQTVATGMDLDDPLRTERVHEILSDIIDAPFHNLLRYLNSSVCIGPLRVIPDNDYTHNPYPDQGGWYSGESAWDVVQGEPSAVEEVNHVLRANDGLQLGCELRKMMRVGHTAFTGSADQALDLKSMAKLDPNARMTFSKEDTSENPDAEQTPIDIKGYLASLGEDYAINEDDFRPDNLQRKVVLWDSSHNIQVDASDLGVGVSQLFPLIIAKALVTNGLIACEQPELHVHPRVQVGIGDLLLERKFNTSSLIETHSEHLILRLLKRVRQTTDSELPEGFDPVKPQDISIVYIEPSDDGVKARRIHID